MKITKLSSIILGYVAAVCCLIFSSSILNAQPGSYYYEYDKAGNRINRTFELQTTKKTVTETEKTFVDRVYPNPASDFVNVEIVGVNNYKEVKIQIIDSEGRVILSRKKIKGITTKINFPKIMSNGVYTIRITLDDVTKTHKLIKVK